ncbi:BacL2 family protein [Sporosarcina sp. FSL K6-1508]|uniref:BacL2 family protein n=1 Tax=Sporosarcina sp. FSL K6-1508 TaxID=2921553 RepID=UPI0030F57259
MVIKSEFWSGLEEMAGLYSSEKEELKKEIILLNIFEKMKGYILTSVNNAYKKTGVYGLEIPKEDFESRFMQYLWEAVESFQSDGSTFKNIVARRFDFAEKHTWRQYKTKGDENDKNGVSYESARLISLDRRIDGGTKSVKILADISLGDVYSAEDEYFEQIEVTSIISEFKKVNERYANVIQFILLGYKGVDLAIATGEADSNNQKFRKLVQRSKESFAKYMTNRAS